MYDEEVLLDDDLLRDIVAKGLVRLAQRIADNSHSLVPNPSMDIAVWIETHVFLPASMTTRPGLMILTPVQRIICRMLQRPGVKRLTFLKTPRMGSTLFMAALLLYFAVHEGVDVLYYERSVDKAQEFHDKKLSPILVASDKLQEFLRPDGKAGVQDKWTDTYLAHGSGIQLRSAFGKGTARSIRARFIAVDEASSPEYQPMADGEGSKIDAIWKRAQEFADALMYIGGTPTTVGACIVTEEFEKGDRCDIEMPCPHCTEYAPFHPDVQRVASREDRVGAGIRYTTDSDGRITDQWYECGNCHNLIEETSKVQMMDQGRDKAHNVPLDLGYVSIFAWLAYSTDPQATWKDIASQHYEQLLDPSKRQTFENLVMAKAFAHEPPRMIPVSELEKRAEDYGGQAPEWVTDCFAGIDHQEGGANGLPRSEMTIYGVGVNQKRAVVRRVVVSHYDQVDADGVVERVHCAPFTVHSMRQIWDEIDKGVVTADGRVLPISRTGSDVGWNMHEALLFAHHPESRKRKIIPVRGRKETGVRGSVLPPKTSMHSKSKLSFFMIGGQTIKDYLFKHFTNPRGTNHSWHFPADVSLIGEDFYEQLLAETLQEKTRPGSGIWMWDKIKKDDPNEVLDTIVYAFAAEQYECNRNKVTRQRLAVQIDQEPVNLPYNPVPTSANSPTIEDRPVANAKDIPDVGDENVTAAPPADTPPARKPVSINIRTTQRKPTAAVATAAPPPRAVNKTRRPSLLNW